MIYQAPVSKNATLGSSVSFGCNVSGSTAIFWLVDGESHVHVKIKARGIFSQDEYDETTDSTKSTLFVNCNEENNGTLLYCITSGTVANNNPALLLIQGSSCTVEVCVCLCCMRECPVVV